MRFETTIGRRTLIVAMGGAVFAACRDEPPRPSGVQVLQELLDGHAEAAREKMAALARLLPDLREREMIGEVVFAPGPRPRAAAEYLRIYQSTIEDLSSTDLKLQTRRSSDALEPAEWRNVARFFRQVDTKRDREELEELLGTRLGERDRGQIERWLETVAETQYVLVMRNQLSVGAEVIDKDTFKGGAIFGDALLYELSNATFIGGFGAGTTNSDEVKVSKDNQIAKTELAGDLFHRFAVVFQSEEKKFIDALKASA